MIHAALGRGSDRSGKLGFFQIRPLASVVHALQQPVELEITVDIHEPVNEALDKGALRQTGAGQALFNRLLKSSL